MRTFFQIFLVTTAIGLTVAGCAKTTEQTTTNTAQPTQQEQTTSADTTMTESEESSDSDMEQTTEYQVNTTETVVAWQGDKIVGASHHGTVGLSQGNVLLNENGQLVGGQFVIDMNSIVNLDLEEQADNDRLIGHLKSDDFFAVETHPLSTLTITDVRATGENTYTVTADLTIKGITNSIEFPATVTINNQIVEAEASFVVDRTLYDVRFGSLKFGPDAIVKDEMKFEVSLVARAQE